MQADSRTDRRWSDLARAAPHNLILTAASYRGHLPSAAHVRTRGIYQTLAYGPTGRPARRWRTAATQARRPAPCPGSDRRAGSGSRAAVGTAGPGAPAAEPPG